MVFERITLINIYDALLQIESNEDKISSILINRVSERGSKTYPRFDNLAALKTFIIQNYPYRKLEYPECQCYTCNEGVANLLNFSIKDGDNSIFVNNMRKGLESGKEAKINGTSSKTLRELFTKQTEISKLFTKYVCYGYINPQPTYLNPCEYMEFVTNKEYKTLIEKYYTLTKRPDFPGSKKINC
jgi:hypothetical protein